MTIFLKKRRGSILKKALFQSVLVLTGAFAWIALFRINDPCVLNDDVFKSVISLQGVFLVFAGLIAGTVSHILMSNNSSRIINEALIAFILIIIAGLIEAWGMGMKPAFLPALIMVVYLLVKIWMNYSDKTEFIKRTTGKTNSNIK
ncbi:hypothetical protein GW934_00390 [Candidatus Falkowbacteria bacterium]|nr:hypothetical protein [Candidatus Falkowbacteria bacterium]